MKIFRYTSITLSTNTELPAEYYFSQTPRYIMSTHRHRAWEILRIKTGRFCISTNEIIQAGPGDIILMSEGLLHSDLPSDCTYESVVFHMNALVGASPIIKSLFRPFYRMDVIPQEFFPAKTDPLFTGMVEDILSAGVKAQKSPEQSSEYELAILGSICRLFSHILINKLYTKATAESIQQKYRQGQIKDILLYVEQNYDSEITVDSMSRIVNMTPNYFCRFFRDITGQTPIDYVINYRVEQAALMLMGTQFSVADIALKCGFNDQSYFTKQFKRFKGTTPSLYRKSQK